MNWDRFVYFAIGAVVCWTAGAWCGWKRRHKGAVGFTIAGLAVFFAYILMLWGTLDRPPLRTMGETRLWYSLFLPLAALLVYARWRYRWILSFSALTAAVFVGINLFRPEIHDKALMPALQSPWFAPHVIVYMLAYALFGAAFLMAVGMLWNEKRHGIGAREMGAADSLVGAGHCFLTLGMLFGALWAKEAWGHYWSWDPKETWAAVTWLVFLLYIHYRLLPSASRRAALWMLIAGFALLQMCWWGINYLPSAEGASVHIYSS